MDKLCQVEDADPDPGGQNLRKFAVTKKIKVEKVKAFK